MSPRAPLDRAFRHLTPAQRLAQLQCAVPTLSVPGAERMVENVLGVFGLPYAVALRVPVDGFLRQVPMVVEEASIVAALCAAAKLAAAHGGVRTEAGDNLLLGQIQLRGLSDADAVRQRLGEQAPQWLQKANALCPRLVARGGGARRLDTLADTPSSVLLHIAFDTCDAMGANIVNRVCEALAPALAKASGAQQTLCILSNYTESSWVRAHVVLPVAALQKGEFTGERVRDGIVQVHALAERSVHRAVTHNKGIMNGIDAVALATGNDWRAIEANAHAYAARGEGYQPLSRWRIDEAGALCGELCMPLKVATQGGNLAANPSIAASWRLLDVPDADALRRTMAAVGLLQNFAALRALACEGIGRGHMALHARSVAASAGVPAHAAEAVIAQMVAHDRIGVAHARALYEGARSQAAPTEAKTAPPSGVGEAPGKVLLFGEHAVVYGAMAVAVPLPAACHARVMRTTHGGVHLRIDAWGVFAHLDDEPEVGGVHHSLHVLLAKMGLHKAHFVLHVEPGVPRAMGLGSSAALAVAVVRALGQAFALTLSDEDVSALAFEAEKVAHATPSGVDNALCALSRPLSFCRQRAPAMAPLNIAKPLALAIGLSPDASNTAHMVRQVRQQHEAHPRLYSNLFERIDEVARAGIEALAQGDARRLGKLMNINHGLLHALDLSTPALEALVLTARQNGALGAKLTGGGGGGAAIALCEGAEQIAQVQAGWRAHGIDSLTCLVPATGEGEKQGGVRVG